MQRGDFVRHKRRTSLNVYGEVLRQGVFDNHWIVRFEHDVLEESEQLLEVLLPSAKNKR